jgi:hypothetical protein
MTEEQGVTFAIVIVARIAFEDVLERNKLLAAFRPIFRGIPIVLVSQDSRAMATYYGLSDILHYPANIPLAAIPWEQHKAD